MSSSLSPAAEKALRQAEKENLDQSVGGRGYTIRVVEETRGGAVVLKWCTGPGRYERESLAPIRGPEGDPLRERVEDVMSLAAEASLRRLNGEYPLPGGEDEDTPFRVRELLARFRAEELPGKREYRQQELSMDLDCLESFLERDGKLDLPAADLDRPTLKRLWRKRKSGAIDSYGEPVPKEKDRREVSPRTASEVLYTVRQVWNWGMALREGGENLLTWNPVTHMDVPTNANPRRPVCSDEKFEAMREAAEEQPVMIGHNGEQRRAPFAEIWVVAGYTGHRAGAVVALRWSDWRPDHGSHGALLWRAESDKTENEHVVPVHAEVAETLEAWRRQQLAAEGDMSPWIFPARESSGHVRKDVVHDWLLTVEKRAGYDHKKGFGLHALRRRFAMKRKSLSPVDVAELGGWQNLDTLQSIYQGADLETMERVLDEGEKVELQRV